MTPIFRLFQPGLAAVRASLKPFLLIQILAVAAVVAYYFIPGFQGCVEAVRRFKDAGGLAFVAVATALAGVVLPEAARRLTLKTRTPAHRLLFQGVVFAILGMTVDLLYRGLAVAFGSEPSPSVVIRKVLVDQLVYSPFFSIMFSTLAFRWEAEGFSLTKTRAALSNGGFLRRYLPLLVTCWCYWIPVLAATYSLPVRIQFILFLCAQGAWSLLLITVTGRDVPRPQQDPPAETPAASA